jgi:two-component system, OmpR family, sensor kinase
LSRVLADAIITCIALARTKNIDLGVERLDDVDVVIDASSKELVLRNRVDNAVRYTPEGGKIDVSAVLRVGELMVEVTDTGPGISDDEFERVLEPFYRLDHTVASGSGLGLSIVSEIARRSGGRLVLANVEGGFRARYFQPLQQTAWLRDQAPSSENAGNRS